MQARCPHCQNIFPTDRGGIQFCPSCGKQINVPLPPGMAPPPGAEPPAGSGGTGAPQDPWGPVTGSTPAWGHRAPSDAAGGLPPGVPPDGTVRQPTPWELNKTPVAFFQTWKGAMGSDRFWSSVQPNGSLGSALTFAWICAALSALVTLPFQFAFPQRVETDAQSMEDLPREVQRAIEQMTSMLADQSPLFTFIGGVLLTPFVLIAVAAVIHLVCLVMRAGKNGFVATARAVCYGYAPLLLGLGFVPLLPVFAVLYWMVLSGWGIARLQDTTIGHGAGVIVVTSLIVCCCVCPAVIGLVAAVIATVAGDAAGIGM